MRLALFVLVLAILANCGNKPEEQDCSTVCPKGKTGHFFPKGTDYHVCLCQHSGLSVGLTAAYTIGDCKEDCGDKGVSAYAEVVDACVCY